MPLPSLAPIKIRQLRGGVPAYSHIPFYSYPSTWKAYVDGTGLAESEHQTYLTFRIPWTCEKDGVQLSTNYYYRVPVTNEIDEVNNTRSLKSNTLYKIKMTVGVLGSIRPRSGDSGCGSGV